jgi:hypothetical protein
MLAVVATLLATLALGTGIASAHDTGFNSRVTIHWEDEVTQPGGRFEGKVTSSNAGCVAQREVKLLEVIGDSTEPDRLVGTLTTDSSGDWGVSVVGGDWDGTYYARVVRKDRRPASAAHDHICRGDRSPDLPVNDQDL